MQALRERDAVSVLLSKAIAEFRNADEVALRAGEAKELRMGVYERGFHAPAEAAPAPKPGRATAESGATGRWATPVGTAWLVGCSLAATAVVFLNLPVYAVYPFESAYSLAWQVELAVFWAGWLAVCFGPALIAVASGLGWRVPDWSVLAIGLGWPSVIVLLQSTLYLEYGQWFVGYLQNNQLLLVSDVVVPAALVIAHLRVGAVAAAGAAG